MKFAVDWDGTCVDNVWPRRDGDWKPGAIDALKSLLELGEVRIHTVRIAPVWEDELTERHPSDVQDEIMAIRDRLDSVGLQAVKIHTKPWKPPANYYIDDNAIRYTGRKGSWDAIVERIKVKHEL